MARPVWFVDLIKKASPQRFWMARLTNLPLLGDLVDWGLFNGDDLIYLPIDHSIKVNEHIAHPGDYVMPSMVVDHFIDLASHHWVMNFCLCREGNGCADYSQQLGCLFLGEAVLKINPSMGRLISKDEAHQHIQRCREAGLVHMIGRTGRAKRTGEAFTLITPDDHAMVQKIEKVMKQKLPQQTLPDFDYDVPKPEYPQTARKRMHHKKRTSPSRPKLRARHPHQTTGSGI